MKKSILSCIFLFPAMALALEIAPPAGWLRADKNPPGVSQQFSEPNHGNGFTSNLIVIKRPIANAQDEAQSPEKLSQMVINEQSRALPMFKVLERGVKKVNEISGPFIVSSYAYGSYNLAAFQFIFFSKGVVYTVVYTTPLASLPALRPSFEKSLASIRIE